MTASTAPSRSAPASAAHRNGLGLSALGLGIAGILVGVFAGGAWFVVVPVGLLTLILGIFGITQKRYYAAADVSAAVVGVAAGAVTLALGISGTGTFLDGLHQSSSVPGVVRPASTGGTITWGQPHDIGDNVVVAVSAPVAFASVTTGDAAARSVVLSVTITNYGTSPYHPDRSVYAPSATFDGQPLHSIALPGGGVSASPPCSVAPGHSVGYRVAYGLPSQSGVLDLTLRPNPNAPQAVIGGQA